MPRDRQHAPMERVIRRRAAQRWCVRAGVDRMGGVVVVRTETSCVLSPRPARSSDPCASAPRAYLGDGRTRGPPRGRGLSAQGDLAVAIRAAARAAPGPDAPDVRGSGASVALAAKERAGAAQAPVDAHRVRHMLRFIADGATQKRTSGRRRGRQKRPASLGSRGARC